MLSLQIFTDHLENYVFSDGETEGKWGIYQKENIGQQWPYVFLWISAAKREGGPEKFSFRLQLDNYPTNAPEITLWDVEQNIRLDHSIFPTGKHNVSGVFRFDWENGNHLYAPFERHAIITHPGWDQQYPNEFWKCTDNITKVSQYLFKLLNSVDYEGIKKA